MFTLVKNVKILTFCFFTPRLTKNNFVKFLLNSKFTQTKSYAYRYYVFYKQYNLIDMKNLSYSIKIKIRTDKKREDNTCPIFLQVIINRKVKKLAFKGEHINVDDWDKTIGRAKGKCYKILNAMLDREEQDFKNFMWENKTNGRIPTMEEIHKFWNGNNEFSDDFFVFYQTFCDNHFKEIKKSSTKHYITLGKKLKKFKPDLKLSDINITLMNEFKTFLEETKSGVYNMIKTIKATLNYAVENEFLKDDPNQLVILL